MNIDNPKLSTDWKESELSEQRNQWQLIMASSAEISCAAEQADWASVLPLAEHRQALIDTFFESAICLPLFQQIVSDLADIQEDHKHVLTKIQKGMDHNHARYDSLAETRASIASGLTTTTSTSTSTNQSPHQSMDGYHERTRN